MAERKIIKVFYKPINVEEEVKEATNVISLVGKQIDNQKESLVDRWKVLLDKKKSEGLTDEEWEQFKKLSGEMLDLAMPY